MEIKDELVRMIASIAEIPETEVQEHVALRELGVDSLMALELVAMVEKRFKIEIPEEEIAQVRTLADILKLIHARGVVASK